MVLFFGRSTLPWKWGASIDKTDFFQVWVIWPPNPQSTKNVFYESSESESALFCISPSPGHLCGPYLKATARTNNGNPAAVLFSQCCKPHLANWQKKMCLNSTFFRYSARSPHRATKPSRGWLRVGVSKPQFILVAAVAARNYVTATPRSYVLLPGV